MLIRNNVPFETLVMKGDDTVNEIVNIIKKTLEKERRQKETIDRKNTNPLSLVN
jgi:hypothetical protein